MTVDVVAVEGVWGDPFAEAFAGLEVVRSAVVPADARALQALAPDARALVVRNKTRVDRALLSAWPSLRIVGRAGVGLDNIDVDAADAEGIVVSAALGANATAVAEHALALALALARQVVTGDAAVRADAWPRTPGIELAGRTWGVVGAGATGRTTGRLARGLGMRVVASDPGLDPHDRELAEAGIELLALPRLQACADVISLHAPVTPATRDMVDEAFLRGCRRRPLLINVSRGELVDEAALGWALDRGWVRGAGLDVRRREPPGADDPLAQRPDVVSTPHVAGLTGASQGTITAALAHDVMAVLTGGDPRHAVGRVPERDAEVV